MTVRSYLILLRNAYIYRLAVYGGSIYRKTEKLHKCTPNYLHIEKNCKQILRPANAFVIIVISNCSNYKPNSRFKFCVL